MLNIGEKQYLLNNGTFLASDINVDIKIINKTHTILKTSGEGDLVVTAFGDIQKILLDGTESLIVDNKHVLCWEETLKYELVTETSNSNVKNDVKIINKFSGKGKIYLQTRHVQSLAEILIPYIPAKKSQKSITMT